MVDPATTDAVGPGTVLGGSYRIEREIGHGGMGVVWEAKHLRVPKRVAVKILSTKPDPEQLGRFRQEAEVTSRIGHPNIVDILDFDTLPSGVPYLVMELLEGESLASRMADGRIPLDRALSILRQIASALHAAHSASVVHRDLKPENVFLSARELDGEMVDHVTVLDFGISKVEGASVVRTRENVVLGTPQYMAPEQAAGHNDLIDPRTDQFALGAIAFEMLAGRPPFEGTNETQVMFKIVYEQPPPLAGLAPKVPAQVVAAIERAMSKEASARFTDLSKFVEGLTGRPLAATDRSKYGTLAASPVPVAPVVDARAETAPSGEAPTKVDDLDALPTVAGSRGAREGRGAKPRTSTRWIVVGAVLVAGASVATWYAVNTRAAPAARATPPPPVIAHDGSAVAVAPPDAAVDPPDAAPAVIAPDASAPAVAATKRVGTAPPREPPVPAEVAEELATAEAALASGDLDLAESHAKHTLYQAATSRAHTLLAEVGCARRDRTSAHSWMRRLAPSGWPAVRASCTKLGFPIDDP